MGIKEQFLDPMTVSSKAGWLTKEELVEKCLTRIR